MATSFTKRNITLLLLSLGVSASISFNATRSFLDKSPAKDKDDKHQSGGKSSMPIIAKLDGTSKQEKDQNREYSFAERLGDFLEKFFDIKFSDVALVYFTYVLADKTSGLDASTKKLWEAGERQIHFTEVSSLASIKAAEASASAAASASTSLLIERAWICLLRYQGITATNVTDQVGMTYLEGMGIQFVFINSGRSPAANLSLASAIMVVEMKDAVVPRFTINGDGKSPVVGPNMLAHPGPVFIAGSDLTFFKNRTKKAIVYCIVEYTSVSASTERFVTEICMEFVYNGERRRDDGKGTDPNIVGRLVGEQNRYT